MLDKPGRMLGQLPWLYHSSEEMKRLLDAFEAMLFGPWIEDDASTPGLEQKVAGIPALFNPGPPYSYSEAAPATAPSEFLDWLGRWVALSHYQGLSEEQRRRLIANLIPLYGQRGTKGYLEIILRYFTVPDVTITVNDQEQPSFRIGGSALGIDSWLGGDRPHWFTVKIVWQVSLTGPNNTKQMPEDYADTIRSVIDLAKPAHTAYRLDLERVEDTADAN